MPDKKQNLLIILTLSIIVILFCLPLFENLTYGSLNSDWNQVFSYIHFTRNSILKHHQFPLRSPIFGGGYPIVGHPQDFSLYPLFFIMLICGEIIGSKIVCLIMYLVGAWGMYYLARYLLKFTLAGSLFSTFCFSLSSWMPQQINDGNLTNIHVFLIPTLVICILKSVFNKKYFFYGAFMFAWMATNQGLLFVNICLFLAILFLSWSLNDSRPKILVKNFILILILAFLFGAIKNFPMIGLLKQNSRSVPCEFVPAGCLNFTNIFDALTKRHMFSSETIYMGYLPLVFTLVAFIFGFRRTKGLLITLCFLLWVSFGPNALFNISKFLWKIPIFSSMYKFDKYYPPLICFIIALSAGYGLVILQRKFPSKKILYLLIFFLIINTVDIFFSNIYFHKKIFTLPLGNIDKTNYDFNQVYVISKNKSKSRVGQREPSSVFQYLLQEKNIGVINWYGDIRLKEAAIPSKFIYTEGLKNPFPIKIEKNPNYKGELFFKEEKGNSAYFKEFKPNSIKIYAKIINPDTLIINQNFSPHWKTKDIPIFSHDGLLALKFEEPKDYEITLNYFYPLFYIGLLISLISLALSYYVFVFSPKTSLMPREYILQ